MSRLWFGDLGNRLKIASVYNIPKKTTLQNDNLIIYYWYKDLSEFISQAMKPQKSVRFSEAF